MVAHGAWAHENAVPTNRAHPSGTGRYEPSPMAEWDFDAMTAREPTELVRRQLYFLRKRLAPPADPLPVRSHPEWFGYDTSLPGAMCTFEFEGWTPATHKKMNPLVKKRALHLMYIGRRLRDRYEHKLWDIWIDGIMPLLLPFL